jgi:tetraether lipid synthase
VMAAARRRPIRHLMINTNGLRIAREPGFAERLAAFMPRFEVYLQFDSLRREALMDLRGADLTRVRLDALAALERNGISATLVVTLKKGVNDAEIAEIVRFALQWRCVRGVTFQPVQDAGRNEGFDPERHRIVLTEIRRRIAEAGVFALEDLIPLPCNPEQICIGYGLRNGDQVAPITSLLPREVLVSAVPNTMSFEAYPELRKRVFELLSLSTAQADTSDKLANVLCCLPEMMVPKAFAYEDTFRVVISQFLDRFNFDLGTVKRSCVHFVQPDGRIIPFDTFNTFYRRGAAGEAALRRGQMRSTG